MIRSKFLNHFFLFYEKEEEEDEVEERALKNKREGQRRRTDRRTDTNGAGRAGGRPTRRGPLLLPPFLTAASFASSGPQTPVTTFFVVYVGRCIRKRLREGQEPVTIAHIGAPNRRHFFPVSHRLLPQTTASLVLISINGGRKQKKKPKFRKPLASNMERIRTWNPFK